jgi:hypothetical protein
VLVPRGHQQELAHRGRRLLQSVIAEVVRQAKSRALAAAVRRPEIRQMQGRRASRRCCACAHATATQSAVNAHEWLAREAIARMRLTGDRSAHGLRTDSAPAAVADQSVRKPTSTAASLERRARARRLELCPIWWRGLNYWCGWCDPTMATSHRALCRRSPRSYRAGRAVDGDAKHHRSLSAGTVMDG